jgi:hypothetical protein
MTLIAVSQISRAGVAQALAAAAAAGNSFPNNGRTFFVVKNSHNADSRTVTFKSMIASAAVPPGAAADDLDVAVASGVTKVIGPFPPEYFNDGLGRVEATYTDAAADLTVQAFSL